jgi:hypothetical protein
MGDISKLARLLVGPTEEERKTAAWYKATPTVANILADVVLRADRIDCDGRRISWSEYGKLSARGWEIDHITPTAQGGTDDLGNLRARHWQGNRSAGGLLGSFILSGVRR